MIPTPLETSGALTSHAALTTFLNNLAADSPRVRVETVGQTIGGKDIYLVAVGYPVAPPAPETASTRSMLVSGYQHGPEVAGKEGSIQFIRDMAYTTDPGETAYLRNHPVYVMPMINADRAPSGVRGNLNDVDLNRDHLALSQPETRAMQETINRVRPQIVVDLHENDPFPNDAQLVGVTNPHTSTLVRDHSDELYQAVASSIVGEGYTYEHFAAGTDVPNLFRNSVGLRHTLAMVMETNGSAGTIQQRLQIHLAVLRGARKYHATNASAITAALQQSRDEKTAEGAAGELIVMSDTATLNPGPLGYRLTPDQFTSVKYHMDTFGIQYAPDGADHLVTMAQPMKTVIPWLIDGTGYPHRIVPNPGGTRVYDAGALPTYVEPVHPALWSPPITAPSPIDYPAGGVVGAYGGFRFGGVDARITSVTIFQGGQEQLVRAN